MIITKFGKIEFFWNRRHATIAKTPIPVVGPHVFSALPIGVWLKSIVCVHI